MASYIVLFVLAIGANFYLTVGEIVDPMSNEMKEIVTKAMKECQHYYNATFDEYLAYYWTNKTITSEDEKCYLTCTLQKFGVVNSDMNMDLEKTKALNKIKYPTNSALVEKANTITVNCHSSFSAESENIEKCEFGYRIVKCFFTEAMKLFA